MEWKRKKKLMFRWSLVSAGLIAAFWGIYYLVNGSVPVVTGIEMAPEWTMKLPWAMSRWWDVLIGPLWLSAIIFIFIEERYQKDDNLRDGLTLVLISGLIASLISGLGIFLIFGLISGLGIGLIFGLISGLAVGLGIFLIFGLSALINSFFSGDIGRAVADWLMVR